jgi:hypothetical protein
MTQITFKYQTQFTCSVPHGIDAIKDFSEIIATDEPQTLDTLLKTIELSFENAGALISEMRMSPDLNHCEVLLVGAVVPLRVVIRSRPSLVIGDQIFKLEEFDI